AAQLPWAQAGVDHQRDRGSVLVVQAALVDQQAEFLLGQRVRVRLTQRKKGAGVSQALDGKAVRLAPAQEPGEGRQIVVDGGWLAGGNEFFAEALNIHRQQAGDQPGRAQYLNTRGKRMQVSGLGLPSNVHRLQRTVSVDRLLQ